MCHRPSRSFQLLFSESIGLSIFNWLLHDVERDLLAIAKFLSLISFDLMQETLPVVSYSYRIVNHTDPKQRLASII